MQKRFEIHTKEEIEIVVDTSTDNVYITYKGYSKLKGISVTAAKNSISLLISSIRNTMSRDASNHIIQGRVGSRVRSLIDINWLIDVGLIDERDNIPATLFEVWDWCYETGKFSKSIDQTDDESEVTDFPEFANQSCGERCEFAVTTGRGLKGQAIITSGTINNEAKQIDRDNLLVIIEVDGELVVDSRLVSERLGVKHKTFLETVRKHQVETEQAFGSLPFQTAVRKREVGATTETFCYLNENQATFLMTLSRNTPQVIAAKISLVKSFSEAKKILMSLSPEAIRPLKSGLKIISPAVNLSEPPSNYSSEIEYIKPYLDSIIILQKRLNSMALANNQPDSIDYPMVEASQVNNWFEVVGKIPWMSKPNPVKIREIMSILGWELVRKKDNSFWYRHISLPNNN